MFALICDAVNAPGGEFGRLLRLMLKVGPWRLSRNIVHQSDSLGICSSYSPRKTATFAVDECHSCGTAAIFEALR